MSRISTIGAVEPKRQRGRLRVAAIMDAATGLFVEKGFDGTTMTEIAARSGTAIGSLYRFFPSKDVLADALLVDYKEHVTLELAALGANASPLSRDATADALVDLMLSLQSKRGFAIALVEGRGNREAERTEFRESMRKSIAKILRNVVPELTTGKAKVSAIVALHLLKGVGGLAEEPVAIRQALIAEIRGLLRTYISSLSS